MLSNRPLTDAELARIEADAPMRLHGLDPEEEAALIAAVREARALVAGLAVKDSRCRAECFWCHAQLWDGKSHAPACAWDAARKAQDAWEGEFTEAAEDEEGVEDEQGNH